MTQPPAEIEALRERIAALGPGRQLIAIAGPPAAGKSTLALELARQIPGASVLQMDGFHLDNRLLDAAGLRHRKGAPESFDAAGFLALVQRLKAGGEVIAPIFDRDRDLAIAGAVRIPAGVPVIVEGNYLLFDQPIWRDLAPLWDLRLWIAPPAETLTARLRARWQDQGCDPSAVESHLANDLANAALLRRHALPADLILGAD